MTDPAPRTPPQTPAASAGDRTVRRPGARIGWIAAWALSLVLAFVLGLQSRPAARTTAAEPAAPGAPAATTQPGADTPAARPSQDPKVTEFLKTLPRRTPNDPTAKGRPDAKVVLIEWSDYRCPFCAVWAKRTMPELQRYVDDGTLRIEYRDLPLFGEQSLNVAVAARAAGRQGKFWDYSNAVFAAAPGSGHPNIGPAEIQTFARTAGVPDLARFTADLADPQLKDQVLADGQQAQQMGITGTPFFVVGTTPINGAQPTATFVQAIEAAKRG
ncbi:DsbA family protein [Mariniluteicoccus flavus]